MITTVQQLAREKAQEKPPRRRIARRYVAIAEIATGAIVRASPLVTDKLAALLTVGRCFAVAFTEDAAKNKAQAAAHYFRTRNTSPTSNGASVL